MPNPTLIPSQLFLNIRSQDKSLLFQFLLAQFLKVYGAAQELNRLYAKLGLDQGSFFTKLSPSKQSHLTSWVQRLAGRTVEYMPTFPWNADSGALVFLHHYSRLLNEKTLVEEKHQTKLVRYSEKALLAARKARDILETWSRSEPSSAQQRAFSQALQQITRYSEKTAALIERCIMDYSRNEHVIFYLLRHHASLDALYQRNFVCDCLKAMFEGSLENSEQFLIKAFAARGFNHLEPLISARIAAASS